MKYSTFRHLSIGDHFRFIVLDSGGACAQGQICVKTDQWAYRDNDGQAHRQNYSMVAVARCAPGGMEQ